jgi:hypothetical protein
MAAYGFFVASSCLYRHQLEPQEMRVLIETDRQARYTRARALHDAAEETLRAIERRDVDTVVVLGEPIEHACEGSHVQYQYPNQVLPPGYDQP